MKIDEMIGKLGRIKPGIERKDVKYGFPDKYEVTQPFIIVEEEDGDIYNFFDEYKDSWVFDINQVEIVPDEEVQSILLKADGNFVNEYIKLNEVI